MKVATAGCPRNSLGICARSGGEIHKAVDAFQDPWKDADLPRSPRQVGGPERAEILEVAENNG